MTGSLARRLVAEAFGAFVLVFAGSSAIVVDHLDGALGQVGVALVWGLTVLGAGLRDRRRFGVPPQSGGDARLLGRRTLPPAEVAPYAASQCLGAILGSLGIGLVFPDAVGLTVTAPSGGLAQSFAMEVFLTLYLMFVILRVSSGSKERGAMAGVAVGGVIAANALCGGPVSGASMNPARSLGPALVSGRFDTLWIYLVALPGGARRRARPPFHPGTAQQSTPRPLRRPVMKKLLFVCVENAT